MLARPRVLILITGLGRGGAEMLIAELLRRRTQDRIDYTVAYVRSSYDDLVAELAATGCPVRCLGARSETDVTWLSRLRRLLSEEPGFDVVHTHLSSTASLARLVVRSLPRSRRPRLVYTEHSSWTHLDPRTRVLHRLTGRWDDVTFAVSVQTRDALPPRLRGRASVLRHGIDLERVRGTARDSTVRDELGVPAGHALVVTAASLTHQKDYPTLLAAAGILLKRASPVRIVAAGAGPLAEELLGLARATGVDREVTFLGSRSDVPRLLRAADAFVLASAWESMPVAVMEALGAGLPCVLTAVGEIPAVVRDRQEAYLVPPRSPAGIADGLDAVLNDRALRERLRAGAHRAAEQFDIGPVAEQLERTYERLAA